MPIAEVALLIGTIKRELKRQGLTYRDVASALHLSEASVKRLFSSRRLTVERLLEVSRLLGYTLAELGRLSEAAAPQVRMLSLEQEAKLVADVKLLLVAVCLLNQWSVGNIVAYYKQQGSVESGTRFRLEPGRRHQGVLSQSGPKRVPRC